MVVHPHPLSWVQSPLVLVSPRICHPDEKSFRRLNQGRFSPGCPPPSPLGACLIGPGSPCSTPSNLGGATGAVGARACVCLSAWWGRKMQCVEWRKKNIAVGSETAGSQRLQDGGMFSVHNGPSPHWRAAQTQRFKDENNIEYTHYCVMCIFKTHTLTLEIHYIVSQECKQHRQKLISQEVLR